MLREHQARVVVGRLQTFLVVPAPVQRVGYTSVRNLTGGMQAWEDAGFPLTRRRR